MRLHREHPPDTTTHRSIEASLLEVAKIDQWVGVHVNHLDLIAPDRPIGIHRPEVGNVQVVLASADTVGEQTERIFALAFAHNVNLVVAKDKFRCECRKDTAGDSKDPLPRALMLQQPQAEMPHVLGA